MLDAREFVRDQSGGMKQFRASVKEERKTHQSGGGTEQRKDETLSASTEENDKTSFLLLNLHSFSDADNRDLLMRARNFVTSRLQMKDLRNIKTIEAFARPWYTDKKNKHRLG